MRKTKLTRKMVERAISLKKDGLCDADIIDARTCTSRRSTAG